MAVVFEHSYGVAVKSGANDGSSGKRVLTRRERRESVCRELALWGPFGFLALKGLHKAAQGQQRATPGRIGPQIIYNTLRGLHKKI
jgi:hypothetical protein